MDGGLQAYYIIKGSEKRSNNSRHRFTQSERDAISSEGATQDELEEVESTQHYNYLIKNLCIM